MNKRSKGFPRLSLKNSIQIMEKAMRYGKTWTKDEFAAYGSNSNTKGSSNSGAFAYRVAALKEYGLISSTKDAISSTDLANSLVKPIDEMERTQALIEAFQNPTVFKEIVSSVDHDADLSKTAIAEVAVRKLGISRDHMLKFTKNFLESGKLAGVITEVDADHFKIEKTKLTKEPQDVLIQLDGKQPNIESSGLVGADERGDRTTSSSQEASTYGASHKGKNWRLSVDVFVDIRVDANLRTEIRNFVAKSDELAEKLYTLEEKGENM